MNAPIAIRKKDAMPALAMNEDELINVLRNSLYPSAQTDSIKLVIGYCKAAGLDPIQKPVHIVPMWDSKLGTMRDVIMPGIGSYRTQAARSGEYAGVSEPEFGDDVTKTLGGAEITYPAWCRVIVKRLLANGAIAEFAATERWIENYAVKGGKEKSIAPNTMWMKRPYAQLAKCAEAQALRKAFPEFSGAQPTADEMEGKPLEDVTTIDNETGEITGKREEKKEIPPLSAEEFSKQKPKWQAAVVTGKKSPQAILAWVNAQNIATLTSEQIAEILSWPVPKPAEAKPAENMDAEPSSPAIDPNDKPFD